MAMLMLPLLTTAILELVQERSTMRTRRRGVDYFSVTSILSKVSKDQRLEFLHQYPTTFSHSIVKLFRRPSDDVLLLDRNTKRFEDSLTQMICNGGKGSNDAQLDQR